MVKALAFVLLATAAGAQRPAIDFDRVIEALRPQGQWEAAGEERYVFRPSAGPGWRPLREGRWYYTDYGWTWKGSAPSSWATDHYGFWSKSSSGFWTWTPDVQWLAASVEWLQSGSYLGWRPSRLDRFSNLLEPETERHGNPSEWNFVRREKLKDALQPQDFADDATTEKLLKNAVPIDHVFTGYREIPRPGPSSEILKSDGKPLPVPVVQDLPEAEATPENAGPDGCYLYRPTFHQDNDGLMRRVHLFLNPRTKKENEASVKETVGDRRSEEEKKRELKKAEDSLERERRHMESLYR